MRSKFLPYTLPPIVGYMSYGYHLGITLEYEQTHPWFFSNFIQLFAVEYNGLKNNAEVAFEHALSHDNPWLAISPRLSRPLIKENIIDFVIRQLDDDYFIETFVDEFYISSLIMGNKNHLNHRLLINGYDSENKTLSIVGYKSDRQFGQTTCTFAEFEQAFQNGNPKTIFGQGDTMLFKMSDKLWITRALDVKWIIYSLNNYIHAYGQDPATNYGIGVYKHLQDSLSHYLETKTGIFEHRFDIRGIHILWEHKKVMLSRIQYLMEHHYVANDSIYNSYKEVEKTVQKIRWVLLRNNEIERAEKVDVSLVNNAIRLLDEAKAMEVPILQRLVDELTTYQTGSQLNEDVI